MRIESGLALFASFCLGTSSATAQELSKTASFEPVHTIEVNKQASREQQKQAPSATSALPKVADAQRTEQFLIPDAVTGSIDFEEVRAENSLNVYVLQSRTFRLKNKIVRVSISDPSIAEPALVSESQLILLGKTPGIATLVLWDDAGNTTSLAVDVAKDYGQLQQNVQTLGPGVLVR